jgi:hypothetical protein
LTRPNGLIRADAITSPQGSGKIIMSRIKLAQAKQEYHKSREEIWNNVYSRIQQMAKTYAELIEPEQETHKDTCSRLSTATGGRIHPKVFYRAVKIIRTKNDVSQYSRSEKGYRSNNAQRY